MLFRLYLILSILGTPLLYAQSASPTGLSPLKPPPGTTYSRELRVSPTADAAVLKEITLEDKVVFLRSDGVWYEVEVISKEGLNFRGWVKGELALERAAPIMQPSVAGTKSAEKNPLESDRYLWLWSGRISDKGSIHLDLGMQKLQYKLTGLQSGSRNTIYKYDFSGLSTGLAFDLSLLQMTLWNRAAFWTFESAYHYGMYRLTLGPQFEVAEVRGAGYQINTHTFSANSFFKYEIYSSANSYVRLALGLGFYMFDVSPDLNPVQNTLLFVETTTQGIAIPFKVEGKFAEDFMYSAGATAILGAGFSEDGTQSPGISADSIPLIFSGSFGYRWADHWSSDLTAEMMTAKGKGSSASSTRISQTYTDAKIDLSYLRAHANLKYHF